MRQALPRPKLYWIALAGANGKLTGLQGMVSMENIAKLLGHGSIEVTEKHYAPCVRTRQDMLEKEVLWVYEIGADLWGRARVQGLDMGLYYLFQLI
jgi:hypothetical protein